MNTPQHAWQRARRRRALITLLLGLPWALAATVLALRLAGFDTACVVGTVGLLASRGPPPHARQLDRQWLQRQLDGSGASEDSADLLFADGHHAQSAAAAPAHACAGHAGARDAGAASALAAWGAGAVLDRRPGHCCAGIRLATFRPRLRACPHAGALARLLRAAAPAVHRLRIDAPAYTGQATLTQNALDAKVAADSRLSWSLRFDRAPDKAWLQFHDGRRCH
jgi:hypothetical protein